MEWSGSGILSNNSGMGLGIMNVRRKLAYGAVSVSLATVALAGCGQQYDDTHGVGDAPVANKSGEDSPKKVTNNPDGFGNVATGCVAGAPGFRYFVTTNTNNAPSNIVVVQDPKCS